MVKYLTKHGRKVVSEAVSGKKRVLTKAGRAALKKAVKKRICKHKE